MRAGFYSLLLAVWCSIALAAETSCPQHFANGIAPDLLGPKLAISAREVCYSGFAIMHSDITRTPIYVAEYLTRDRVEQAKGVKRDNRFHPDVNIPADERAELRDYDRGHLAPAANMPDEQSQHESFSLANVVPQVPANNRGVWARLEKKVRKLAQMEGRLYVITGAIFDDKVERIGGAVSIPAKLFKVVYLPNSRAIKVFWVQNADLAEVTEGGLSELEKLAGMKFY